MESTVASTFKKVVGTSAIGAISVLEMINLQQASATPANFNGSSVNYTPPANPGSAIAAIPVQVSITVDGASGVYTITNISTPVQPTGANAPYGSFAIPTLTSSALSAQSANVQSVSGATLLSVAWKSSLSSAISAAAAAGQSIGMTVPAPTPGVTTPAATTQTVIVAQAAPVVLGAGGVAAADGVPLTFSPVTMPVYVPPLSVPTLNSYLGQITSAIAQLPATSGARGVLTMVQANLKADITQSQAFPGSATTYVTYVDSQLASLITQANKAVDDYNAQVQAAIVKLNADAKVAAAAALASPAPTPTVTVTVTVTVTPTPAAKIAQGAAIVINKTSSVISKSLTCVKTVSGKTTTKIVSGLIAKCPTGFTLLKK